MAEEAPEPRALGLERLSPDGLEVFSRFIQAEVEPGDRLFEAFREELRGMPDRDLDKARTTITALARSKNRIQRELACHAVPYLAVKDPDTGFPLWCELANSADPSAEGPNVNDAATQVLLDTLGVLDLNPEGVLEVMRASSEWRHETA
jgi:hypothetical protein